VKTMANLSSVLKSEITRLARKEIKCAVDPLRKANAAHRREIAELKRQVASLQRELKVSGKSLREKNHDVGPTRNVRFASKGLKSLRARLGLSAADFGLLVGASGQSIYNWEAGKAVPRAGQQVALAAVRGLGKREAEKRLSASS
jgi:DNA-binding transcriptional regulator YiaG